MPVSSIVLAEHLLLALFAVPVVVRQRRVFARLRLAQLWGSAGGDWFWRVRRRGAALHPGAREQGNPTTASLLQNTQPLFVVLLATALLKERLERVYWPCLGVSLVGACLLSFGTIDVRVAFHDDSALAAALALSAAALWASGTVLARLVLSKMTFVTLTAARILFALPLLLGVSLARGDAGAAFSGIADYPLRVGASALLPGLLGVLLFYRGLRSTKACHATLAEFMYPAAALVGNWLVLGTLITPLQGTGCLLLISVIVTLAWWPTLRATSRATRSKGAMRVSDDSGIVALEAA